MGCCNIKQSGADGGLAAALACQSSPRGRSTRPRVRLAATLVLRMGARLCSLGSLCSLCYRFSCVPSVALTTTTRPAQECKTRAPALPSGTGAGTSPSATSEELGDAVCLSQPAGGPLLTPVVESPTHHHVPGLVLALRRYFYIAAIGQRGLASFWLVLAARMSRTAEDNRAAGVESCVIIRRAEPQASNGAQGNNETEQS